MENNYYHSDPQERGREKARERQSDLWSSTTLQTLLQNARTTDHVTTYKLISQNRSEWETDVWVAAMELKKALDST